MFERHGCDKPTIDLPCAYANPINDPRANVLSGLNGSIGWIFGGRLAV